MFRSALNYGVRYKDEAMQVEVIMVQQNQEVICHGMLKPLLTVAIHLCPFKRFTTRRRIRRSCSSHLVGLLTTRYQAMSSVSGMPTIFVIDIQNLYIGCLRRSFFVTKSLTSAGSFDDAHVTVAALFYAVYSANAVTVARIIGATVVTVPTCAFLLQSSPDKGHGHHDPEHEGRGHQDHAEDDATSTDGDDSESEGDEKAETQSSDETSGSDEEKGKSDEEEGKSDEEEGTSDEASKSDESSGEEEEQQNTPDTSDDEEPENETQIKGGGGDVEGVQFKGATKHGKAGDTRKSYPDPKGGNKKRIESDYGIKQAEDPEGQTTVDGKTRDKVSPRVASRQERCLCWYALTII